jgi:hypothetical protein
LGRQIVLEQSKEPGKREFIIEPEEIRDVLTNETGTGSVIGISFDTSNIGEVSVSKDAFEGMRNLRFLRIYRLLGGEVTLQIPEDMDYIPRLRLLYWDRYPRKSLPRRFKPERLVELHMPRSNLELLWGGIEVGIWLFFLVLLMIQTKEDISHLLCLTCSPFLISRS